MIEIFTTMEFKISIIIKELFLFINFLKYHL